MTTTPGPSNDLGRLLESTRRKVLRITIREAARRAGISEGRWRQIVRGERTPERTVVAMALAVRVDPAEALGAAGLPINEEDLATLITDVRESLRNATPVGALAEEVERIQRLPLPAEERMRMITAIVAVAEEAAAERQADERRDR